MTSLQVGFHLLNGLRVDAPQFQTCDKFELPLVSSVPKLDAFREEFSEYRVMNGKLRRGNLLLGDIHCACLRVAWINVWAL